MKSLGIDGKKVLYYYDGSTYGLVNFDRHTLDPLDEQYKIIHTLKNLRSSIFIISIFGLSELADIGRSW